VCVCVCVLGMLVDMKALVVTSVALGKAHGAMLTSRGDVYTFGPNNKGQCGRRDLSANSQRTYMSVCLYLSVCLCLCCLL